MLPGLPPVCLPPGGLRPPGAPVTFDGEALKSLGGASRRAGGYWRLYPKATAIRSVSNVQDTEKVLALQS